MIWLGNQKSPRFETIKSKFETIKSNPKRSDWETKNRLVSNPGLQHKKRLTNWLSQGARIIYQFKYNVLWGSKCWTCLVFMHLKYPQYVWLKFKFRFSRNKTFLTGLILVLGVLPSWCVHDNIHIISKSDLQFFRFPNISKMTLKWFLLGAILVTLAPTLTEACTEGCWEKCFRVSWCLNVQPLNHLNLLPHPHQ